MTLEKAISICQARIDLDRSMRDNKVESDYEKFCENECLAIERLIEECKIKTRRLLKERGEILFYKEQI